MSSCGFPLLISVSDCETAIGSSLPIRNEKGSGSVALATEPDPGKEPLPFPIPTCPARTLSVPTDKEGNRLSAGSPSAWLVPFGVEKYFPAVVLFAILVGFFYALPPQPLTERLCSGLIRYVGLPHLIYPPSVHTLTSF